MVSVADLIACHTTTLTALTTLTPGLCYARTEFGEEPLKTWVALIRDTWRKASFSKVSRGMMSIIIIDTFNYAMDTITAQFGEVRGHALNRLGGEDGAAATASSDSFALSWGGTEATSQIDDTRFMPAPMAFLNDLPADVRRKVGLLKPDGTVADHAKECPLFWTAAAKRIMDRLEKLLTFVGGNAKSHFGAMFSKSSFEGEYGERITVNKGSQFSLGTRGPLTVHNDGGEFVNIGEVYDETTNTTQKASKKKKKASDGGQEKEPPPAQKKPKVEPGKATTVGATTAPTAAPTGGGAAVGGATGGKPPPHAPGKVVRFGARADTPGGRPVGPTYEEYVGMEKVIFDFGLCSGTTAGKVKIATDPARKETDTTRYRYVRYDGTGGHSSDMWAPPGGWAESLKTNTLVCRKDLFAQVARFEAKYPDGLIGECQGQQGIVKDSLTCKLPSHEANTIKCSSGAHAFDNTFWAGRKVLDGATAIVLAGSAHDGSTDTLEPWCKDSTKLNATQWAAMAAAVPEFIQHYTGEAPGSAADFEDKAAK